MDRDVDGVFQGKPEQNAVAASGDCEEDEEPPPPPIAARPDKTKSIVSCKASLFSHRARPVWMNERMNENFMYIYSA